MPHWTNRRVASIIFSFAWREIRSHRKLHRSKRFIKQHLGFCKRDLFSSLTLSPRISIGKQSAVDYLAGGWDYHSNRSPTGTAIWSTKLMSPLICILSSCYGLMSLKIFESLSRINLTGVSLRPACVFSKNETVFCKPFSQYFDIYHGLLIKFTDIHFQINWQKLNWQSDKYRVICDSIRLP